MTGEGKTDNQQPHYLGHRQRLRERFLKAGFAGFAEHETVELLLTLAIPRRDVKQPAKALLERFHTVRGIMDAPVEALSEVDGIGTVAPTVLKVIREFANLYQQLAVEERENLADPEVLHYFWRTRLGSSPNELFQVGFLDGACRLFKDGVETIEEGTTDRATVYPRRVVEAALKRKASSVVFAHNHPDGNAQPSEQDKLVTRALVLALETVQINVLDHLIVTADKVFSFRKAGLL
ncbi:MAG: DNA repair protein RadC [candidate division WOR-3 bacterium]|nr:DNA repair protein RadC [candidate division WOR-3 bacterium]